MARTLEIAFFNGEYLPLADVSVSPLDRVFLFGDGVYEVVPIYGGKPLLMEAHLARLDRSLQETGIENPYTVAQWQDVVSNLATRNGGGNLTIYLQVTRGADSGRDQVFPENITPTMFGMASDLPDYQYANGVTAITLPDNRWGRCDIKSTSLLANVLARQHANQADAIDAILIRDGQVTEAAVSSVLIVERGELVRRFNGKAILPGTTTDLVVELAREAGVTCREEVISETRLRNADEIWLTGATKGVAPVIVLDGDAVGTGRPGPVWKKVTDMLEAHKNRLQQ
jgi:D-alanine transaminase